jgi:ubiquinone/menaquinone biosynthesis C-methylase UbiE
VSDSSQTGAAAIPDHFLRDAPQDAHQMRRHRAVLDLLRGLPPGRVLDYGFGWGDIAWAAARTHPDIHGVDVEVRRVEFARREYAPIAFDQCRPDGLDFPDASFDIVLSIVVLPFVPDDNAYMADIRRVLRPGGHLIVATKTSPFLTRWWRRLAGRREQDRHPAPGIRHHDAGDAARLLDRHGFEILERRAFYDPPFESRKNPVDVVNGVFEVAGERLGLIGTAPYPLFLARRAD